MLHADALEGNQAARGLIRTVFGDGVPVAPDAGVLHYVLPLADPPRQRNTTTWPRLL